MAKKELYIHEAERLYVIDQLSYAEIASRLPVSERTLGTWANQGDWPMKRRSYLEARRSFHEELYEFARALMKAIRADFDAGETVEAGRLFGLGKIIQSIMKAKDYEDVAREREKDQQEVKRSGTGISDEAMEQINALFGITTDKKV